VTEARSQCVRDQQAHERQTRSPTSSPDLAHYVSPTTSPTTLKRAVSVCMINNRTSVKHGAADVRRGSI
jgi:hypothetical protein